jgi:hypothetical protein
MKYFSSLFTLLFFFSASSFCQYKKFSHQQLEADLSFLVKTVENVHPNPYHDISKDKFYKLVDSVRQRFSDSMTTVDAWPLFAKIIASYNEGHSTLSYPDELQQSIHNDSIKIFPVLMKEFDGEFWVARYDLSADSAITTGDRITKINGVAAKELMERFTSLCGGLSNWRNIQVLRDFSGTLALHNINSPYQIEYLHNGEKKEVLIQGIPVSQLFAKVAEVRKRNPVQQVQANYTFTRIDGNTGYLNFRSMKDLPVFNKFLDSTFTDIKNNPVEGLIIDLRQNGGGNSVLGQSLLNYITNKPYRMGAGSKWKVSDEYKAFIQSQSTINAVYRSGSFKNYIDKKTGEIISELDSRLTKPGKNDLRYSENICVLIGPNTFSSANMLTNAIKDYQLATLIGEATGEPGNDYGELYWNNLPNTQLKFYTCSKQFIRANRDANDPNPIFPDIEIKQSSNSLKDEVLEFAKEWVKKK